MLRIKTLSFLAAFAALLVAHEAWGGRGGSVQRIERAIGLGNGDAIIAEVERAEKLVCPACATPVLNLLDHPDVRVREVAAWWLGKRPFYRAAVVAQSVARLNGDDGVAARNAAETLGTFRHPGALPALSAALDRSFANLEDETHAAVMTAVGVIGHPDGEAIIIRGLAAPGPLTREAAGRAYYALRGNRSGEPLRSSLGDPDVNVRRQAAAAIGSYATASARATLEALLASDPDAIVRRNAAWSLGKIGSAESYSVLRAAADGDSASFVRSFAKAALRNLR